MLQRKTPVYPQAPCDPVVGTQIFGEKTIKELEDDLRDDASFTSSISGFDEETIDYRAVYTLHVFVATVDGQISVIRGEKLKLLDDTNTYWWLVQVLKTSEIGYIPAENIETPFERLARFNKYKNAKISSFPLPGPTSTHTRSSNKKVSLAKTVSVQSVILVTDAHNNPIGEQFEIQQASIDDPLLKKQLGLSKQPPIPRLSDHMLSLGLTQHFMQTRGTRPVPPPLSTTSTPTGITNRSLLKQSELHRIASPNSSTSPTYSGTVSPSTKEHISVLRVFAGNISVKATFNSVLVNENTTAEQLLVLALERFRLLDSQQQQRCDGVEYYITVKVSDGDEITLSPQDKPLAMFRSLNAHLTTPMPSLTHIRSKIHLTRIGVTKSETNNNINGSFGENSVTRFSLNKRIKRINEQDGHLRIKIAYYDVESTNLPIIPTTTSNSTSRFARFYPRSDAHQRRSSSHATSDATSTQSLSTRIEKLVAVPGRLTIHALIELALEKFHIQQYDGNKTNAYGMVLVLQGKEYALDDNRSITNIMTDKQLITNGNLDASFFTLKKLSSVSIRPSAPTAIMKQEIDTETLTKAMTTMVNDPSLLNSCTMDNKTTDGDFGNSDISLISASSSTSSSDSSRSLTSPDLLAHTLNSSQERGVKLTTDALLQQIDMTLSNLEQNESVVSGALHGHNFY